MSEASAAPAAGAAAVAADLRIAPSILAADYGHFVPPITFGPPVVAALAERIHARGGIADVHLMIEHPERQIEAFAATGADIITIHVEAAPHLHHALASIRAAGCLAGAAINPGTPAETLFPVVDSLDLALCMTVSPGWGGQRFIPAVRQKVEFLREVLPPTCAIEVDGGVDLDTAPLCVEDGANLLVAGSAVFGRPSPASAYRGLAELVGAL